MTKDQLESHIQELMAAYKREPSDELLNQIFEAQLRLTRLESRATN